MTTRAGNDWRQRTLRLVAALAMVFGLAAGRGAPLWADDAQTRCYKRENLDPRIEVVIDEFRASVARVMDKGGIPGAAVALVDDQGILWTEGFGHTGGKPKRLVTPDTQFLTCGISKLITATSVMTAVQDGLLKLDQPITSYLPDFKINSRYEEHAEREITLRYLLNSTAGMPMEATIGNYFEPSSTASFQEHAKSLFNNWLICPTGSSYYYSSTSFDLAAYAIQVAAGMPFEQYLKKKVFTSLGMSNSTADRQEILDSTQRAVGHMMGMSQVPVLFPALGAAGVYSTARDLARLVQLHINQGLFNGQRILDQSLVATIHQPVGILRTDPNVYYGMGITIDRRAPERTDLLLWHDGQGFGFQSLIYWYPEYGIGAVVLTNRWPHSEDLAFKVTDQLIKAKTIRKRFACPELECHGHIGTWWGWPEHKPTPFKAEWKQYVDTYSLQFNEYSLEWWAFLAVLIRGRDEYTPRIRVAKKDGLLCVTESKFFEKVMGGFRHRDEALQEVKPGVFSARGGEVLDFTRPLPTWRNYRVKK